MVLADAGKPNGNGDEIQITILDGNNDSTGVYGKFSGSGLTFDDGQGDLTVGPATSLAVLQAELRELTFTPAKLAAGSALVTPIFALDIQSGLDGTGLNNASIVITHDTACYCRGTRILTDRGERPVETLCIGQSVVTAAGQHRAIKWIGRRAYAGRFLLANPAAQPIRFQAGSLGDGLPRNDLLVSPQHAMFLDGMLIPANCLVNGSTIVRDRVGQVEYYHVELDSHDVLLAEGAPSESFLDDDSRGVFHNAIEFATLYPYASQPDGYCAARVEHGPALEAIRQRLSALARPVPVAA